MVCEVETVRALMVIVVVPEAEEKKLPPFPVLVLLEIVLEVNARLTVTVLK